MKEVERGENIHSKKKEIRNWESGRKETKNVCAVRSADKKKLQKERILNGMEGKDCLWQWTNWFCIFVEDIAFQCLLTSPVMVILLYTLYCHFEPHTRVSRVDIKQRVHDVTFRKRLLMPVSTKWFDAVCVCKICLQFVLVRLTTCSGLTLMDTWILCAVVSHIGPPGHGLILVTLCHED